MIRKQLIVLGLFLMAAVLLRPFFLKPIHIVAEPTVRPVAPKPAPVKPVVVEKPLHKVDLPDFAAIKDVKQKKSAFFNFIRPAVESNNQAILAEREQVEDMLSAISLEQPLTDEQRQMLAQLAKRYRVSSNASQMTQLYQLLTKVDEIPTALVLVQAANESAWGTSRFARIGLNFFGIWCYKKGCGMVPRSRNVGANHEVEAFQSVDEAIKRYLHNINTNSAYHAFRTIRKQLREQALPLAPQVLASGLLPYSERGSDYVLEISDMLRHNRAYLPQTADFPDIELFVAQLHESLGITAELEGEHGEHLEGHQPPSQALSAQQEQDLSEGLTEQGKTGQEQEDAEQKAELEEKQVIEQELTEQEDTLSSFDNNH